MSRTEDFVMAIGKARMEELRLRAVDAVGKHNRCQMPGMDMSLGDMADGYGWIAVRAYELVELLNALTEPWAPSVDGITSSPGAS